MFCNLFSKSSRNKELAKFMLHTRAIDAKGSNVASSSRPIIIPYQSRITRLLEGIVFWPLREIGLVQSSETIQVREELMNNYLENVEPTDKLEFSLSTNAADIEGAYLSIFPERGGGSKGSPDDALFASDDALKSSDDSLLVCIRTEKGLALIMG